MKGAFQAFGACCADTEHMHTPTWSDSCLLRPLVRMLHLWKSDEAQIALHHRTCLAVAGRDGGKAECVMYYRFSDALKQAGMVSFEPGWDARLNAMMRYASSASTCRRSMIARCCQCPGSPYQEPSGFKSTYALPGNRICAAAQLVT